MKQSEIKTGITTPKWDRYNDTDWETNKKLINDFGESIVKLMELPENWSKYLLFQTSSDYITLQTKVSHGAETFRRFKRGSEARIPADLKEKLIDHIECMVTRDDAAEKKRSRELSMRELLTPLMEKYNGDDGEWRLHYYAEQEGLRLILMSPKKSESIFKYESEIAEAAILHNGKFVEPRFDTVSNWKISMSQVQIWMEKYKPVHDKIMNKLKEILKEVPAEFFVKETTNA